MNIQQIKQIIEQNNLQDVIDLCVYVDSFYRIESFGELKEEVQVLRSSVESLLEEKVKPYIHD